MSPIDAAKVRTLRKKKRLTQQQLADKVDVSRPRITELETGKSVTITVETLEKLAAALDCEPADLLTSTRKRGK